MYPSVALSRTDRSPANVIFSFEHRHINRYKTYQVVIGLLLILGLLLGLLSSGGSLGGGGNRGGSSERLRVGKILLGLMKMDLSVTEGDVASMEVRENEV